MVSFFFMIKRDLLFAPIKIKLLLVLASVSFSVRIQQEELMGWHPSGVRRARIRVIEVNFSEFLIKGNGI